MVRKIRLRSWVILILISVTAALLWLDASSNPPKTEVVWQHLLIEIVVAVVTVVGILGVQRLSKEKDIYLPLVSGISVFFLGFFVDALEDIYEPGMYFEVLEVTGLSLGIVLIVLGIYRWMNRKEEYQKILQETTQELKEEKDYREKVQDSFDDVIYIHDTDGEIIDWNGSLNDVTGYSDDEIEPMNALDLISEGDRDAIREGIEKVAETGNARLEARLKKKDGEGIPYEFISSRITNLEGETVIIGIGRDISERKKHEKRLRTYRQAIESSEDLIAAVDRDFNYLFGNESYIRHHAASTGEVVGKTLSDVLGEETFEEIKPHLYEALDGEVVEYEMERENPEGEKRHFRIRYYPFTDDEGEIRGIAGSLRDITDQKERQERLERLVETLKVIREVNEFLVREDNRKNLSESIPKIITDSNLFGSTFVYFTDENGSAYIGKSGSELSKEQVEEFHTDEYLQEVFEEDVVFMEDVTQPPYQQHLVEKEKHSGVAVSIHHSGKEFGSLTVHSPPGSSMSDEEVDLLNDLADDIGLTLHSIRERELREGREKEYRSLYNSITDPVFVHEIGGEFVRVNQAAVEKLGYSEEELLELEPQDITVSSEEEVTELTQKLQKEGGYLFETVFLSKSGEEISAEVHASVSEYRGEKRILSIARDITDLKQQEKHLRVFDRILRHNMHNKMNVVLGYSDILIDKLSGEEREKAIKIHEKAEDLVKTTDKEEKIIELISQTGEPEEIYIDTTAESVVTELSEDYPDAEIRYEAEDEGFIKVQAMPEIRTAIEELVENAVTHNDQETPHIEVRVESDDDKTRLCISDNGPTIPEMERGVLTHEGSIEPLYHGSGLGLWLVHWIVRESGGELKFEKNDPRGNIVTMQLSKPDSEESKENV